MNTKKIWRLALSVWVVDFFFLIIFSNFNHNHVGLFFNFSFISFMYFIGLSIGYIIVKLFQIIPDIAIQWWHWVNESNH